MHRHLAVACAVFGVICAVGCKDEAPKEPIRIGVSASLSGFDEQWGAVVAEIVQASVDEINDTGGIDGHDLELIVRDDGSEVTSAEDAVDDLLAEGVVGIVGPFLSGQVAAVTPTIATAEVPLISPSSTAPELAMADDDGYMFRTAPNDSFQVLAMSHYFRNLASPAVTEITIVHEEGAYGEGLAGALTAEWQSHGGHTIAATLSFPAGIPLQDVGDKWAEIAATNPSTIVLIGLGSDSNLLVNEWAASGLLPDLQWFGGDAVRQDAFFGIGATALAPEAVGIRGTAPTYPTQSTAYQTYIEVMLDRIEMDLTDEAYFPNTWDAVYLLAAGLVAQAQDGDVFGGPGLRDALHEVSQGGQTFHAGQWRNLVSQIQDGADVDYDGASGPCELDDDGETLSPYEVWEVQADGTDYTFVQVEYMEVSDLTE
jgi:ABC-type branched-subunit amino acid transport system substrate-binding protein